MESDSDDSIFLTQTIFRTSTGESSESEDVCDFLDIPYCPKTEPISDNDEHSKEVESPPPENIENATSSDEYEINRELAIMACADELRVGYDEIEKAMLDAVDVRDMPSLGGASMASAYRPYRGTF